jgi:L-fucose mutarotase
MLLGISPLISPELLDVLYRMGHGDEIVLADGQYPGHRLNRRVGWACGIRAADLLAAVLPLFPLDMEHDAPVTMMRAIGEETPDPEIEAIYRRAIDRHWPTAPKIAKIDQFGFDKQARDAFAVVLTGDTDKYTRIILTKGRLPEA